MTLGRGRKAAPHSDSVAPVSGRGALYYTASVQWAGPGSEVITASMVNTDRHKVVTVTLTGTSACG